MLLHYAANADPSGKPRQRENLGWKETNVTLSTDADTDARIQKVFRSEFNNATCITVAHRLNTIMDSDYVLVMDDGRAAEFDKPSNLLSKEDGIFRSLVDAWEE